MAVQGWAAAMSQAYLNKIAKWPISPADLPSRSYVFFHRYAMQLLHNRAVPSIGIGADGSRKRRFVRTARRIVRLHPSRLAFPGSEDVTTGNRAAHWHHPWLNLPRGGLAWPRVFASSGSMSLANRNPASSSLTQTVVAAISSRRPMSSNSVCPTFKCPAPSMQAPPADMFRTRCTDGSAAVNPVALPRRNTLSREATRRFIRLGMPPFYRSRLTN